jgi:uncharacterized protein YggE
MDKSGWLGIIGAILAIGVVLAVWNLSWHDDEDTLQVSGTWTTSVAPDEAIVMLSVETKAKTSQESQQQNAELTAKVVAALKEAGIPEADITTAVYSLTPEYFYPENKEAQFADYKTTNGLRVTIRDMVHAGDVIDKASAAGANRVDSIQFDLSNSVRERMRQVVLTNAAANAKLKATVMASGLGVTLGDVKQVSESYYSVSPAPYYAAKESMVAATPIQSGTLEVSATVAVTYEIG